MKQIYIHKILVASLLGMFAVSLYAFPVHAQSWYYPMDRYQERIRVKDFGTLIDDAFYKGKEHLFPFNRFHGYHAAVDLEVFDDEKNKAVPVHLVHSGKIKYIGSLSGYGGLILQSIDGEDRTVLYGHVKISNLKFRVGDAINAGEEITVLGEGFSEETSKERKHLHFGIYKGTDLYFRGHEQSKVRIFEKWENPTEYLMVRGAILPDSDQLAVKPEDNRPNTPMKQEVKKEVFSRIINFLRGIFDKLIGK